MSYQHLTLVAISVTTNKAFLPYSYMKEMNSFGGHLANYKYIDTY